MVFDSTMAPERKPSGAGNSDRTKRKAQVLSSNKCKPYDEVVKVNSVTVVHLCLRPVYEINVITRVHL